jgi:DNA helicase-2/ATP-dependent DNA helicase PcrA
MSNINLSESQLRVTHHIEGPILVMASPGSGKTQVLTERVRNLITYKKGHYRVLALTFSNKAADEMRERLINIEENIEEKVFIGTIHRFCMDVLNSQGKFIGLSNDFHIFDSESDRQEILREAFDYKPELKEVLLKQENKQQFIKKVLDFISAQKRSLKAPDFFEENLSLNENQSLFAELYREYDNLLRQQNAIDYDDLIFLTYRIFIERPSITNFYQRLYRYVCIDEAQDLNFAQYELIKSFCDNGFNNIMMVGDPNQAIYGFNGADSKYMCDLFIKDFSPIQVKLNENYRSTKEIIEFAKMINPTLEVQGKLKIEGEVSLKIFNDEKEEAEWIINNFKDLTENGHSQIENKITFEDCAVIARNKYILKTIEDRLRILGIPYYTRSSNIIDSESDFIRCFELGIRLIINPSDRLHFQHLLEVLNVKKGIDDIKKSNKTNGIELLNELNNYVLNDWKKPYSCLLDVWSILSLDQPKFSKALNELGEFAAKYWAEEEESLFLIENDLEMWKTYWKNYVKQTTGDLHDLAKFRNQIALGTVREKINKGIGLLTVHASKGLEFQVVHILGMSEGTFPDYRATKMNGKALEEEKHNIFVAITRAKRVLYLSYSKTKVLPTGKKILQSPSRFLPSNFS